MLKVIEYGKDEYEFPALLVLGCFDAIHLGHRELLKKAKLQAKINGLDLGVMLFKEGKSGKLVYSFDERLAILEQFNVKFVVAIDYNDEFKSIAPIDFLQSLEDKLNIKAYMSGKDFRFGAGAKGKSSTLKNYADDEENGVWYMPIKDVELNGEKVSTTLIKSCLDEGNVTKANELLGTNFSVGGEVVKGEGRGTSVVGYPTVNIVYPEWKHPLKHGVYSVKSKIDDAEYAGVANFGTCPTFGDDRVALEVYFEGFSGDLYGQTLEIEFLEYLRDIEEFGSAEELTAQITADIGEVPEEAVEEQPAEETYEEVVEEQPVEEIYEEVVEEQPAEETYEEVVEEQPSEEVTEEVVEEQPAEETYEEVVAEEVVEEQPIEEVTEEVVEEQPVEETYEEVAEEQPAEETYEEVAEEQPAEEVPEEVAEEQPAEEVPEEQPVEETYEEVVEEQPAEETYEEAVEEQPAEEVPDEVVEEQPIEEVSEEVAEDTTDDEEFEQELGEEYTEE